MTDELNKSRLDKEDYQFLVEQLLEDEETQLYLKTLNGNYKYDLALKFQLKLKTIEETKVKETPVQKVQAPIKNTAPVFGRPKKPVSLAKGDLVNQKLDEEEEDDTFLSADEVGKELEQMDEDLD